MELKGISDGRKEEEQARRRATGIWTETKDGERPGGFNLAWRGAFGGA